MNVEKEGVVLYDEFIADEEQTKIQIETAEELIKLVEKYLNEKENENI